MKFIFHHIHLMFPISKIKILNWLLKCFNASYFANFRIIFYNFRTTKKENHPQLVTYYVYETDPCSPQPFLRIISILVNVVFSTWGYKLLFVTFTNEWKSWRNTWHFRRKTITLRMSVFLFNTIPSVYRIRRAKKWLESMEKKKINKLKATARDIAIVVLYL